METLIVTQQITDETLKSLVEKSEITIEDNTGSLFFEDDTYLIQAVSNFGNGNIDIDIWMNDDEVELELGQDDIIWEKIEEERNNIPERDEDPYFYLTNNK